MRLITDTDSDLDIVPVDLNDEQANPERQFPSFYNAFQHRFNQAYSPRGQYNDTDTPTPEVTNQMSNTFTRQHNSHNSHTMVCGRTVILWDGRRLHPEPRGSSNLTGSSRKPRALNYSSEQSSHSKSRSAAREPKYCRPKEKHSGKNNRHSEDCIMM